jgi:peptidoglycan/LPS O-acetylase OafA/YrhL
LRFEGRGARGVALVALALIVGIATATDFPTKTYLEVPGIVIASLGLVIATLLFVQALLSDKTPFTRLLVSGPMRLVGTMSYTLYLAHPYVYLTMREIGKKIGLSAYPWQLTFPIYLMMTTAAALSVSWVVHRFVEVAPYKKFYGKRIYRDPLPERLLSSEAVIDPEAPLDVNRASL